MNDIDKLRAEINDANNSIKHLAKMRADDLDRIDGRFNRMFLEIHELTNAITRITPSERGATIELTPQERQDVINRVVERVSRELVDRLTTDPHNY